MTSKIKSIAKSTIFTLALVVPSSVAPQNECPPPILLLYGDQILEVERIDYAVGQFLDGSRLVEATPWDGLFCSGFE